MAAVSEVGLTNLCTGPIKQVIMNVGTNSDLFPKEVVNVDVVHNMWLNADISIMHILVGYGESLVLAGILGLEEVLPLLELSSLHGLAGSIMTGSSPIRTNQIALGKTGRLKSFGFGGVRDNWTEVRFVLGVAYDVRTGNMTKLSG